MLSSLFLSSILIKPILAANRLYDLKQKCSDLLIVQQGSATSELLLFLNNFLGGIISLEQILSAQKLTSEEEFICSALEETFKKIQSYLLKRTHSAQSLTLKATQASVFILGTTKTPEYKHKLKIKLINSLASFFDKFNPALLKDRQELAQAVMGLFALLYWIKKKPQLPDDNVYWQVPSHTETLKNILSTPLDQHEERLSSSVEQINYFREKIRKDIEDVSAESQTSPGGQVPSSQGSAPFYDTEIYHPAEGDEHDSNYEINSEHENTTSSETTESGTSNNEASSQIGIEAGVQTDPERKNSSTQATAELSTQTEDQSLENKEQKESRIAKNSRGTATQTENNEIPEVITIETIEEQSRSINEDLPQKVNAPPLTRSETTDSSSQTQSTISTQTDPDKSTAPADAKSKALQKIKNILKNPNLLKALLAAAAAGTLTYGGKKLYDAIKKHLDEQKKAQAKKTKKRKKVPAIPVVTKEEDAALDALDKDEPNLEAQAPILSAVSEKGARYLRLFLGVSFASKDSGNLDHLKAAQQIYQELNHPSANVLSDVLEQLSSSQYQITNVQKMFRDAAFEFEAGSSERVILNSLAQRVSKLQIHSSKQIKPAPNLALN